MARDEALLERVGQGESPATLRFYFWERPTISLGYFQAYADYESLPPPAGELAVVRRTTGGGAILHDREITYSLSLPVAHALLEDGPTALYARMHAAIIAALGPRVSAALRGCGQDDRAQRGPFFCFARRHRDDVVLGGQKLAGSAQRRTRQAVLQHGSLILERRFAQQECAELALAGADAPRLMADIAAALALAEGLTIESGAWSEAELAAADRLQPKYASPAWTRRR